MLRDDDTYPAVDESDMEMSDDEDERPPKPPKPRKDLLPFTFAASQNVQGVSLSRALVVLLDSGSTSTWISRKALPKGVHGKTIDAIVGSTLAGQFKSSQQVVIDSLSLPEFHRGRVLPELKAMIFEAPCRYDMIIGRDVLRAFGLSLDFETDSISTEGLSMPMREFPKPAEGVSVAEQLVFDFLDRVTLDDEDSSSDETYPTEVEILIG